MNRTLFFLLFSILSLNCFSAEISEIDCCNPDTACISDTINMPDSLTDQILHNIKENKMTLPGDTISKSKNKFKTKKIIASVLSFPFPFGLLGLHRVFLGTKPYIPFVYIGTLGGCFLILPVIDFVAIVSANEETLRKFENNPKVFMWSH